MFVRIEKAQTAVSKSRTILMSSHRLTMESGVFGKSHQVPTPASTSGNEKSGPNSLKNSSLTKER